MLLCTLVPNFRGEATGRWIMETDVRIGKIVVTDKLARMTEMTDGFGIATSVASRAGGWFLFINLRHIRTESCIRHCLIQQNTVVVRIGGIVTIAHGRTGPLTALFLFCNRFHESVL